MRVRLYTLTLFVALSLLGQGCTREPDYLTTEETWGIGHYQLEGREVRCQAHVSAGTIESATESLESISISLRTTPQVSYPTLILDYHKTAGRPDADYQVALTTYLPGDSQEIVFYEHVVGKLTETSPGVFAGTFTSSGPGNRPITAGAFTGARLQPSSDYRQPKSW